MLWMQFLCNFYASYKKYENPWVGFVLTPSGDMMDLNAMTTTQQGTVIKQSFTNKANSTSARFSDRKKIRGYPSEPSLIWFLTLKLAYDLTKIFHWWIWLHRKFQFFYTHRHWWIEKIHPLIFINFCYLEHKVIRTKIQ